MENEADEVMPIGKRMGEFRDYISLMSNDAFS